MSEYIKIGLIVIWLLFLSYWIILAQVTKKVKSQEPLLPRFLKYWLPIIIAAYLSGPGEWFGHTWIRENFVPHSNQVGLIGISICFVGLVTVIWSRYNLGKNWSFSVQVKEDHELIQNGIYKIIRHPIYTGLLLLFIGNTLINGDYRGIIAVVIVSISLWFKIKKEEKLLFEIFGKDYIEYKNKTKALIPFVI
ncbi:MAG: isoprenylcysteine carboxylmethyltransferase family protein [Bacteroidales bacterium]|nr:isoprenylcysteine carboxylmethyltransferase family protein [Bacteroidales bacterium]